MNKATRYRHERRHWFASRDLRGACSPCSVSGCSGGRVVRRQCGPEGDARGVGKFYVAKVQPRSRRDEGGPLRPANIFGIATATVPPGAQKAEVAAKSVGETVVITIPSQELTLTASLRPSHR